MLSETVLTLLTAPILKRICEYNAQNKRQFFIIKLIISEKRRALHDSFIKPYGTKPINCLQKSIMVI